MSAASRKRSAAPSPAPPPPSPPKVPAVEPVEQRWEETEGKYLHKKFKKMATATAAADDEPAPAAAASVAAPTAAISSPAQPSPFPLKHSALSMLASPPPSARPAAPGEPSPADEAARRRRNTTCPFCQLVCAKPSVLDKHIRTHTNERPYPCDICKFAFKTKSNLYKHKKSRTHALKVEQGVDSDSTLILEELGSEGRREEIESPAPPPQSAASAVAGSSPPGNNLHHPQEVAIRYYSIVVLRFSLS